MKLQLARAWLALCAALAVVGPVIAWGNFITVGLNFLIVAFCIFLLVKGVNTIKKKRPAAAPADPADVLLLREIRDLLKPRG